MNKKRFEKIKKVLIQRQPDLTVLMENVHKPHNLAAIARSSDAVGIHDIYATAANDKIKLTQKTSGGVKKWVRLHQEESSESAAAKLKANGYTIVSTHLNKDSIDYREVDYTKKTAIVLGAELHGITPEMEKLSDTCIHIPMHGMTQSLNVSVACALVLFEAERQRKNSGLYKESRLNKELFIKTLFEWAYPDIAGFCSKRKIEYPEIDMETGLLKERFLAGNHI